MKAWLKGGLIGLGIGIIIDIPVFIILLRISLDCGIHEINPGTSFYCYNPYAFMFFQLPILIIPLLGFLIGWIKNK